jgi:hypothetical protein
VSEDLTSDEQADPAEDGLAHVLDCVTRLARPEGPCPDWRAEKSNEPDSPLRLLLSLPLCLG